MSEQPQSSEERRMSQVREWKHAESQRDEWGAGPWQNEPDKIQWIDEATGLDCLMHRHPRSGHWCGYVGVAEGHPAFEKEYDNVEADVHGGLTYSAFCQDGNDESVGICHVPYEGRPHRVWWLGFDCAHYGDLSPISRVVDRRMGWESDRSEAYRARGYVEGEVRNLAGQLKQMVAE